MLLILLQLHHGGLNATQKDTLTGEHLFDVELLSTFSSTSNDVIDLGGRKEHCC